MYPKKYSKKRSKKHSKKYSKKYSKKSCFGSKGPVYNPDTRFIKYHIRLQKETQRRKELEEHVKKLLEQINRSKKFKKSTS